MAQRIHSQTSTPVGSSNSTADSTYSPAFVGCASRGPVKEPILLRSSAELEYLFGEPTEFVGGNGLMASYLALDNGTPVVYTRAESSGAQASASLAVEGAAYAYFSATNNAGLSSTTSGSCKFEITVYDRNGTQTTNSPYFIAVHNATPQRISDCVSQTLGDNGDFYFDAIDASAGTFVTKHSGASAKLTVSGGFFSGTNAAYLAYVGAANEYIGGASGIPSVNGSGTNVSWTYSTITTNIKSEMVQFKASVGTTSATDTIVSGAFASSVGGSGVLLTASSIAGGVFGFQSMHTGSGYNYQTRYNNPNTVLNERGLQLNVYNGVGSNQNIQLVRNGGTVEESHEVQLHTNGTTANSLFASSVVNGYDYTSNPTSDWIYASFAASQSLESSAATWSPASADHLGVSVNGTQGNAALGFTGKFVRYLRLATGLINFTGGNNGDVLTHNALGTSSTHMDYAVANAMGHTASAGGAPHFDTLCAPGFENYPTTRYRMQNLSYGSYNSSALNNAYVIGVSPPLGLPTSLVKSWLQGTYGYSTLSNIARKGVWCVHNWVKVFNRFTGSDMYIEPIALAAPKFAKTADATGDWWSPITGASRGTLTQALDTYTQLSPGDLASRTGATYAVNTPGGSVQLQNDVNAYDSYGGTGLDLRMSTIRITQELNDIGAALQSQYVGAPNDVITWNSIKTIFQNKLATLQVAGAIESYSVVCDASTNTAARIAAGDVWCSIGFTPIRSIERLVLEVQVV
jgi:hypothetical protein